MRSAYHKIKCVALLKKIVHKRFAKPANMGTTHSGYTCPSSVLLRLSHHTPWHCRPIGTGCRTTHWHQFTAHGNTSRRDCALELWKPEVHDMRSTSWSRSSCTSEAGAFVWFFVCFFVCLGNLGWVGRDGGDDKADRVWSSSSIMRSGGWRLGKGRICTLCITLKH